MTITLYDCVEGEEIARGSVDGGDPPKQVTTRGIQVFTGKNGYGSKPKDDQLEQLCLRLIESHPLYSNQNSN